jgi:hypothetical protein
MLRTLVPSQLMLAWCCSDLVQWYPNLSEIWGHTVKSKLSPAANAGLFSMHFFKRIKCLTSV